MFCTGRYIGLELGRHTGLELGRHTGLELGRHTGRPLLRVFLLMVFLCSSCITEVENDETPFVPQEGMNVVLTQGKPATGVLYTSADPFGDKPVRMHTESNMYLYKDGTLFDSLQYKANVEYFAGTQELSSGNYYCSATLYDSVSVIGHTNIPEIHPIEYDTIVPQAGFNGGINDYFQPYSQLRLTFPNNDDQLRYYHIKILQNHPESVGDQYMRSCGMALQEDPVLVSENLQSEAVFTSELMDSANYELAINFFPIYEDEPFYIEVRYASYDYYEYAKSIYLREEEGDADFFNPIFPTEIYTNVKPTGVVYGYAATRIGPIDVNFHN